MDIDIATESAPSTDKQKRPVPEEDDVEDESAMASKRAKLTPKGYGEEDMQVDEPILPGTNRRLWMPLRQDLLTRSMLESKQLGTSKKILSRLSRRTNLVFSGACTFHTSVSCLCGDPFFLSQKAAAS